MSEPAPRTFSQAELDQVVERRLAKERKKIIRECVALDTQNARLREEVARLTQQPRGLGARIRAWFGHAKENKP